MAHNYTLRVTAGSAYDPKSHRIVPVNTPAPLSIESHLIKLDLNVRIQNYRGVPRGSPKSSPYFDLPLHAKNKDTYSICFRFMLKQDINGDDLVFGNDFDHPIRDRLPPGFGTAFKIVKWAIDPGLDGDPYADEPYLHGPVLSSMNAVHVGSKTGASQERAPVQGEAGLIFEEGGSDEGLEIRREHEVPETEAARRKFFLQEENRRKWEWESGRTYGADFFNGYLDFNDLALRLPGFTLPIMKYWDGQGLRKAQKRSHTLRYVLKNRKTNEVLFVVVFALYLNEDLDEEGNVKPGVEEVGLPFDKMAKERAQRHDSIRHDVVNESSSEGSIDEKKGIEDFYDGNDDLD